MNVLYARNDHPGILITCPHCHMAARHDLNDIGDAIKEGKSIECVMCGNTFRVFVEVASNNRRPTKREADSSKADEIPYYHPVHLDGK